MDEKIKSAVILLIILTYVSQQYKHRHHSVEQNVHLYNRQQLANF